MCDLDRFCKIWSHMYTSDIPNKDALDKFIARCDNIRCNNQTKEKEATFEAIYNMFAGADLGFIKGGG